MSDKPQDAVSLLLADHRLVEELFTKYDNAGSSERARSVAEKLCTELVMHTMIEEEILYPALRGEVDDYLLDEGYVAHDTAKVLMYDLMAGSPFDPFFDAKIVILSQEIRRHIAEEERRDGMFAQARASGLDLHLLGARMAARRKELEMQLRTEGSLPPPTTLTLRSEVPHGSIAAW